MSQSSHTPPVDSNGDAVTPKSVKATFDIGGFTKEFDVEWPPPPEMMIIAPLSLRIPDFKTGLPTNDAPEIKRWRFVRKQYDGKRAYYVFYQQN